MLRARFYVDMEACGYDYRPVKWPIKYPYWCSGETMNDEYILVAYVDSIEELKELWPEADNIDAKECSKITFTDRFHKPDWYQPKENNYNE